MKKTIKKPELLAPAGTLEKLKIAIDYGADAVYIGGQGFGLRTRAGNFSFEEMQEGVAYAERHQAKVYVAANMVTHVDDEKGADEFFKKLAAIGIHGVIVSDPALIEICQEAAPALEVHLSTQASAVNAETLNFWQELGLKRVVLGREVTMEELKAISQNSAVDIEVFVHGAMCISYSGRCVLSNHMSLRDANRGGCSQSCRWKYQLYDLDAAGNRRDFSGSAGEPFSMSAVDLCMLEYLPDLIENGADSLKIEGRMKSIHYVSTVVNVYRKAIDTYLADPAHYQFDPHWLDEIWKVSQRELSTGFYYAEPTAAEQLFGPRRKRPTYTFIGEVLAYDEATKIATIRQRNHFSVGDAIEFYGPQWQTHFMQQVEWMENEDGERIDRAPNPMMLLTMPVTAPVRAGDMIRKKGEPA